MTQVHPEIDAGAEIVPVLAGSAFKNKAFSAAGRSGLLSAVAAGRPLVEAQTLYG